MENQVVPPPINLRTTFLGKHGRSEDEVGREGTEMIEGEVGASVSSSTTTEEKKDDNPKEFEPPTKKRKIDTESVEVRKKSEKSTDYKPMDIGQDEEYEEEDSIYSERPRRSNRKPVTRMNFDASELCDGDKISRKKTPVKPIPTTYKLNVNSNFEEYEMLRERQFVEKDKETKTNVIFSEKNRYETGIMLVGENDSLSITSDSFFLLLYFSGGYGNVSINEGNVIKCKPGISMRIPKGNTIKIENQRGCIVRISYTKLFFSVEK